MQKHCRLPFGITSAPTLFQWVINQILGGLPRVQRNFKDILCTEVSDEEPLCDFNATPRRLIVRKKIWNGACDRRLRTTHCTIKTFSIVAAPPPQNVSQLWSFLGLLNHNRCFIPTLASILQLLYKQCQKGKINLDSQLSGGFQRSKWGADYARGPELLRMEWGWLSLMYCWIVRKS